MHSRSQDEVRLSAIAAPNSLKECAYRFVQKAFNNSFKHAGGLGQRVTALRSETCLVFIVSDQGPGLREKQTGSKINGMGRLGLRDRIETLGGRLDIRSSPAGCTLPARFDLQETRQLDAGDVGSR